MGVLVGLAGVLVALVPLGARPAEPQAQVDPAIAVVAMEMAAAKATMAMAKGRATTMASAMGPSLLITPAQM